MKALALLVLLSAVAYADGSGSAGSGVVIDLPIDADAPQVSAAASPTELTLGSRFTLFVTAVYNGGVEVNLPAGFDLGDTFEIKKTTSEDHLRADGKHVREWQLDVVAWDLGDLRIPGVPVTFTINGHGGQVMTNAVPLRVSGVLGDTDDPKLMRGNAPPVRLQASDWTWIYVGGGVFVVVAGALTYWVLRRRRRQHVRTLVGGLAPVRARRLDMTSERALERLLAIEQTGVLARDDDRKTGYADMVGVIRDYLAARYRFATAELTTSELMRGLAKRARAADTALVEAWVARCDLVKYGGVRASEADANDALAGARDVVMKTTVQPAATKEAA